ncbi:unnamed protein product [Notodromas monacha]|uniref:MRH domain-containing protein n=1 Tax=Notodromas monacha TaxID=399045 RepID=A0A7R9BLU7_9CRUS|nr:unnamed protein product [Notodromas monacha]CAG0917596.1 unnamed protein product [Notodromas monacha]
MFESPLAIQLNASQALNINLCKPFKPHSNSDICRNADSSAYVYGCLTQETSKKNMSLGRYWKAEQVSPSQTVVKVFEGSRCPSDKSKKISAVLTLICVAEHKGEAPVVNSTACDYQITWKTRFACPLKRVIGTDCKVTDDLHGWTFDFSNLSRGGKYLASGGSGDVFVSLCKPLTKPEECRGSGVCAKLDKSQNSGFQKLGNASSAIVFEEGSLSLKYTGGEPTKDCPRGTQSLIIFACEEDSTTSSETTSSASPEVLMFASCTMHILWRTKLACPGGGHGFEVSPVCKSTTTNIIDFTKLAMNGRNYEIPAGKSQTILLDVCAKLARGGRSGSGCSYDSGACLVVEDDKSGMRRYVSLGRQDADNVQLKTFPKNQSNILTYKHGDVCEVAGSAVAYHELSMLFLCDPKIPVGKPVLVKHPNNDPCMWRILWRTSAACPVLQPIDVNLDDGGDKYIPDNIPGLPKEESKVVARGYDCRLKDPASGQKYDLNPLPKQVKVEAEDYKFNLSICNTAFAEMGSATCWSGVGCCVKSSKTGPYVNGGWFTPMLELRSDHSLELNYVGGDKCPKMASRRLATRIKFICAESKKESKARPTFLGLSSDCKFEFEWKTSHACPFGKNNSLESAFVNAIERGKCMVRTNDSVVDFSPLMSSLSNYKFIASSAAVHGHAPHDRNPWEYFLAVCRSLVPVPGLDCDPAAAACRGHATASNYTDVQVLGKFQTGPWVDVDGQVHLTYTDGSKCPTSAKDGKFSTDVAFKCGPGLGEEKFLS